MIMGKPEFNYTFSLDDVEYDTAVDKNELEREIALLHAAVDGDCMKLKLLLKSGVSVEAKKYNKLLFYASKSYFTPLHLATLHSHYNCVQVLINYWADVNAKDIFGFTALHFAAFNGAYNILKLLLHSKADCSVAIKFSPSVLIKYSGSLVYCKIPHLDGTTPLHLAAASNNVDCVKYLIRYGADFNAVDEYGRTSLYIAAQLGYSECVLIHLKEAVGQDILSLPSFKTSDTPLHFAVKFQMIDCVKELLYLGSDVNHKNFEGLTPLHTALLTWNSNMSDMMTILKLLVLEGYKTDVNQTDSEGFTPLHYVSFGCNKWLRRPEMAKFLIAYGANVNIKNSNKCSLLKQELMYAEENFSILNYLVKSLLYLPSLESLNITPQMNLEVNGYQMVISPVIWDDEDDFLDLREETLMTLVNYPDIEIDDEEVMSGEVHESPATNIYRMNTDEAFNNINANRTVMKRESRSSLILKKQLWYDQIASSPRTLKHHCRFLIRSVLGPMKLKYIKQLPIPKLLQSYLLFELNE